MVSEPGKSLRGELDALVPDPTENEHVLNAAITEEG